MSALQWMAWTQPTALFFAGIGLLLVVFTGWGIASPSVPRKGLLPMVTTRGDRLFVGLLGAAFINLAWVGLTDLSQWFAVVIAGVFMLALGRFG